METVLKKSDLDNKHLPPTAYNAVGKSSGTDVDAVSSMEVYQSNSSLNNSNRVKDQNNRFVLH